MSEKANSLKEKLENASQKVNDFRVFFAKIPEGIQRRFEKTLKIADLL